MSDRNDLPSLSPEEQQQLLSLAEEQQSQIQELSSMNSELAQELQKVLEKNEKLNRSDLELKKATQKLQEAEKLKSQAEDIQAQSSKKVKQAERERDEAKQSELNAWAASEGDRYAAKRERKEAERLRKQAEELLKNREEEIRKAGEERVKQEIDQLHLEEKQQAAHSARVLKAQETAFEIKYAAQYGQHHLIYLFCAAWCVIQAVCSPKVVADISQVFSWLAKYATMAWGWILSWSKDAASVTNGISNTTLATVLYWVVYVFIWFLAFILLYGLAFGAPTFGLLLYFGSDLFDQYNKRMMVVTGILWIAASTAFPEVKYNLFLFWVGFQLIPLALKKIESWFSAKDRDEKVNLIKMVIWYVALAIATLLVIYAVGSFLATTLGALNGNKPLPTYP